MKSFRILIILNLIFMISNTYSQDYDFFQVKGNYGHQKSSAFTFDSDYLYVVASEYCGGQANYEGCFIQTNIFKVDRLDGIITKKDSLLGNDAFSKKGLINTSVENSFCYFMDGGYRNYTCGLASVAFGFRTMNIMIGGDENNLITNHIPYPELCAFRFNDGYFKEGNTTIIGIEKDPIFGSFGSGESKLLTFDNNGQLIESILLSESELNSAKIIKTNDELTHIFYRNNQSKLCYVQYDNEFNLLTDLIYDELPKIDPLDLVLINNQFIFLGQKNFHKDTLVVANFNLGGEIEWNYELVAENGKSIEVIDNNIFALGSTSSDEFSDNVRISFININNGELFDEVILGDSVNNETFFDMKKDGQNLLIQGNLNCCDLLENDEYGSVFIMRFSLENIVSTKSPYENKIQIYPNPVINDLVIEYEFNNSYDVIIFDLLGKRVLQIDKSYQRTKIDMKDLDSGMYILHVEDLDGRLWTNKILKF